VLWGLVVFALRSLLRLTVLFCHFKNLRVETSLRSGHQTLRF
jgi:hypothetical protein